MSPRGSWPRGGVRTRLPVVFRKSGAEFTPKDITGLALWLDASDSSTLFQDAAATTPATATNDPVGAWLDKSGNGRHATQSTGANRPLVGNIASGRGLVFDSNDSLLSLASIADIVGSPASSPAMTIAFIALNSSGAAGFTAGSDNAANGRLLVSNSFDAAGGSFFDVAGASASARLSYTLPASSQTAASVYVMQRSGASMTVRRNGATIATKSDASQTFSATTARLSIGQAIGLTGFSGTCGSMLCYPSAISTVDRQRIERYLANRWGITLAPQVSNADAQDWINRVYANGGTVSASTASAVNAFCDAIDAAAIRDRFYRLNLFCGGTSGTTAGLNSALVPLYLGPAPLGIRYGNTTDTNVGPFLPADYNETGASGGLVGNGTSKYLNTGFATNTLADGNRHLAAYAATWPNALYNGMLGSESTAGISNQFALGHQAVANKNSFGCFANTSRIQSSVISGGAFWIGVNDAAGSGKLYRNGSQDGSAVLSASTPTASHIFVFALNRASSSSATDFFSGRLSGYSIGLSMTDAQAASYNTAMQALQTALQRNV